MTVRDEANSCGACRFFSFSPRGDLVPGTIREGACRRRPPTWLSAAASVFPVTHADNWCGEFQQVGAPLPDTLRAQTLARALRLLEHLTDGTVPVDLRKIKPKLRPQPE